MRFAMSYSCGKDSTLALHRMIEQGHQPICLVVMVNESVDRSYFHGADRSMLERYSEALGLSLIACPAQGDTYQESFEAGLEEAKLLGAQAACFGDIDIEQNRRWEEERCEAVGLQACFPLWQQDREQIIRDVIGLGYECLIKTVDAKLLPTSLLGMPIGEESLAIMRAAGIDACGENGEYHTLAVDGPVFKEPLRFQLGDVLEFDDHATIAVS